MIYNNLSLPNTNIYKIHYNRYLNYIESNISTSSHYQIVYIGNTVFKKSFSLIE